MAEPHEDYEGFLELIHHQSERFEIFDDSTADWCLRKIAQSEASINKRAAYVAAEIERLRGWQAHEDAQNQRTIDFFTSHLLRYAEQLKLEGVIHAKHRSHKLPHGTLSFRSTGPQFEPTDDATLQAWAARTDPQRFLRQKVSANWGEIKHALVIQEDGSIAAEVISSQTGEVSRVPVEGVRLSSPSHDEVKLSTSLD